MAILTKTQAPAPPLQDFFMYLCGLQGFFTSKVNQSVPLLGTGTHTSSPFNMVLYNICFFVIFISGVIHGVVYTFILLYLVPRIILPGTTGSRGKTEREKNCKCTDRRRSSSF